MPKFLRTELQEPKKRHQIFDVKSSQMLILEENKGKSSYDKRVVFVAGDEFRAFFSFVVSCYCLSRREQKSVIIRH